MENDIDSPKHGIAALIREKSRQIDVKIKDNIPVVNIKMNLNGYLNEYKYNEFKSEKEIKELNEHIQNQLQVDCQNLFKYMKGIGSDPLGIGDLVRAKYNNYWNKIDWHKTYKNVVLNVDIKLNIIDYGGIQ